MEPVVNEKFGKLIIAGAPVSRNGRYWPCNCECGATGIMASITSLKSRRATNGGCNQCSRIKHGHGRSSDPTYSKYQAMRQRCENPNHKDYCNYGGRGITVCERWMDFANFLADMGTAPAGMTIERERVNEGYEPGNCRWATKLEQARNTRGNVKVEIDGKVYGTIVEAAEAYGIPIHNVRMRLSTFKWNIEKALKTPVDTRRGKRK